MLRGDKLGLGWVRQHSEPFFVLLTTTRGPDLSDLIAGGGLGQEIECATPRGGGGGDTEGKVGVFFCKIDLHWMKGILECKFPLH